MLGNKYAFRACFLCFVRGVLRAQWQATAFYRCKEISFRMTM